MESNAVLVNNICNLIYKYDIGNLLVTVVMVIKCLMLLLVIDKRSKSLN